MKCILNSDGGDEWTSMSNTLSNKITKWKQAISCKIVDMIIIIIVVVENI